MYRRLLASGLLMLRAACALNPSADNMVRICDESGCSDRP